MSEQPKDLSWLAAIDQIARLEAQLADMASVLRWYAHADWADLDEDLSLPQGETFTRPGKRARAALARAPASGKP